LKNPTLLAALVVLLVPGNWLLAALPKVDITGVAGGAHWMWVEAENASAIAAGFSQWRYDASGQSSGMFDPNPSDGPGPKRGSVAQAIYVVPADRNPPQIVSINTAQ
jgi:hypothetical protein